MRRALSYDSAARIRARKRQEVALNASTIGPGYDRYVLPVDKTVPLDGAGFLDADGARGWAAGTELPRVFRTGNLRLNHAASCPFRYSSKTSCGVR
jgi:hypothetical protein